jgi:hypothetical protein
LSIAWGVGRLSYHGGNSIRTTFTTENDSGVSVVTTGQFDFYALHGISMIIIWTVLTFFGYCAARFMKHNSKWAYVHFLCCELPALYTFALLIATIVLCKDSPNTLAKTPIDNSLPTYYEIHLAFGFVFLGLITVQIFFGLINIFGVYYNKKVQNGLILNLKLLHRVKRLLILGPRDADYLRLLFKFNHWIYD